MVCLLSPANVQEKKQNPEHLGMMNAHPADENEELQQLQNSFRLSHSDMVKLEILGIILCV